jgi:thioredoxin reductase
MRPSVRAKLEGLLGSGQVRALLSTEVAEIGERHVTLAGLDGRTFTIDNDAVIVQVGGTPPSELLASFGVKMVEKRGEE